MTCHRYYSSLGKQSLMLGIAFSLGVATFQESAIAATLTPPLILSLPFEMVSQGDIQAFPTSDQTGSLTAIWDHWYSTFFLYQRDTFHTFPLKVKLGESLSSGQESSIKLAVELSSIEAVATREIALKFTPQAEIALNPVHSISLQVIALVIEANDTRAINLGFIPPLWIEKFDPRQVKLITSLSYPIFESLVISDITSILAAESIEVIQIAQSSQIEGILSIDIGVIESPCFHSSGLMKIKMFTIQIIGRISTCL